ncbi:MAG: hypothetical protein Q9174_005904, partial [Haloplaca sp. 1 TL-2023]
MLSRLEGHSYPDLSPDGAPTTVEVGTAGSVLQNCVAGMDVVHSTFYRNPRLPCLILPPRISSNNPFIGRQEYLDGISDVLLPKHGQQGSTKAGWPNHATLTGVGGIGKTEIALEFVRRYESDFDAIFWVQASSRQRLDEAYHHILWCMGLQTGEMSQNTVKKFMDDNISRELLKIWLSHPYMPLSPSENDVGFYERSPDRARWLMIYDDVACSEDLIDFIPKGNGAVLVTSRHSGLSFLDRGEMTGWIIPPLPDDDGAQLLRALTREQDLTDSETLRLIVRRLRGSPLALRLTAAFAHDQRLLADVCYQYYKAHDGLSLDQQVSACSQPQDVALQWTLCNLSACAKKMLQLFTFFDPYEIPEVCFVDKRMSSIGFRMKGLYSTARHELLKASLVEEGYPGSTLTMAKPIRDAVLSTLSRNELAALFRIAVRILWSQWLFSLPATSFRYESGVPKYSKQPRRLRHQCGVAWYPHIRQLKETWEKRRELEQWAYTTDQMRFAALLNDAAWYRHERGCNHDFDGFFDLALRIVTICGHQDRDFLESDIYLHLGTIAANNNHHSKSRDYKDTSHHPQALKSSKEPHERLALSHSQRAISFIQDGQSKAAIDDLMTEQLIRRALGIRGAMSRNADLGYAYMMQGNPVDSESVLQSGLEQSDYYAGVNEETRRFVKGRILHTLGNLYESQERFKESFDFHSQALNEYLVIFDEWDHRVADLNHKLAQHLLRDGRYGEAYISILAALKSYTLSPTAYKPNIARSLFLKSRIEGTMSVNYIPENDDDASDSTLDPDDMVWSPEKGHQQEEYLDTWASQAAETAELACRLRREYLGEEA